MILKKAEEKDLPLIKKILLENNLPVEDLSGKIDLFFAIQGESLIGVGGIEKYKEYGLLRSVAISDKYKDQGYGTELIKKLIYYATYQQLRELYLLTTTAKGFFEHLGFTTIDHDQVPEVIQKTTEFSSLCPSTAFCMKKIIQNNGD